ncbi:flagellin, partial [Stenotrophomonas sp. TWI1183]|uniref:flagellin n=1 Tax=Stenotrophomonas sp. TWI1183 TaxID=3136799 RepID=UPI00320A21D4
KLLDGSFSSQLFQVGANAGQAIAIDKVVDATVDKLGTSSFKTAAMATIGATPPTARSQITGTVSVAGADGSVSTVDLGKVEVAAGASEADFNRAAVTAVNSKLGETGVLATISDDGTKITLTQVKSGGDLADAAVTTVAGTVALTHAAWDDTTGDWSATKNAAFAVTGTAAKSENVADLDISSVAGAQKALSLVDNALESINSTRADLGAIQNRFTSVVANLQTSTENLSASRSRIKDTDFAKETAELTRTQILQQAG